MVLALCYGFPRRATVLWKTLTLATFFLQVKMRISAEVIEDLSRHSVPMTTHR
jgi:hypothetical protein